MHGRSIWMNKNEHEAIVFFDNGENAGNMKSIARASAVNEKKQPVTGEEPL